LGPYRGERYHLLEFHRQGQPQSREAIFNCVHSSLRCIIEHTFGVWKKRWRILQNMLMFPYKTQVQIVVASMTLHNYIIRKSIQDVAFNEFDRHPNFIPDDILTDVVLRSQTRGYQKASYIDYVRDDIATSLIGQ